MRRMTMAVLVLAALAACNPTVDEGIFGIGSSGGGSGGGAATHLVFTAQPVTTQATAAMASSVIVQAEDGVGAVDTSYSDVITLSFSANPDGGSLGGNFSVNAINGVATFSNLTVDKADTGYVLLAVSGALTTATSTKFTITP
ncbi:MAG TPA: hypothetical protein VH113_11015 [Gemmatimonadales bacterium]|nr:hypothetical protein [Gemmatimonadales bacterium]